MKYICRPTNEAQYFILFYCISFAHALGWSFYLTLGEYKREEFSTISLPYRGKLTSPIETCGDSLRGLSFRRLDA